MTKLYRACEKGDISSVNACIASGEKNWNDGLSGACMGGNIEIVELMISKGADDWNSELCSACAGKHKRSRHSSIKMDVANK